MKQTIFTSAAKAGVNNLTEAPVIAITYLESGYHPIYTKANIDDLNVDGVTPEIQESAVAGSMFGWECTGAALAVEFFSLVKSDDSYQFDSNHILSNEDFKAEDGNMSTITPVCSCGWRGLSVAAYNDDQHFQIFKQYANHRKLMGSWPGFRKD